MDGLWALFVQGCHLFSIRENEVKMSAKPGMLTDYDSTTLDEIVVKLCEKERECNIACEAPKQLLDSRKNGFWVSANCTQSIETTQVLVRLLHPDVFSVNIDIYGQGGVLNLLISQLFRFHEGLPW